MLISSSSSYLSIVECILVVVVVVDVDVVVVLMIMVATAVLVSREKNTIGLNKLLTVSTP